MSLPPAPPATSGAPTPRAVRRRSCASWSPTSAPSSSWPPPRTSSSGPSPPSATGSASPPRWATPCWPTSPPRSRPASTWSSSTPATTSSRPSAPATPSRRRCRSTCSRSRPSQSVAEQDAAYGKDLYKTDPDLCCALRKVKPLADTLAEYDAWATGLRRAETHNRVIAPVVGWDAKKGKVKVSPLARWSDEQVEQLHRRQRRAGQPARPRRLPLHRLLALHPPRRAGRRPAQRPLGRHHQDRVRHPP